GRAEAHVEADAVDARILLGLLEARMVAAGGQDHVRFAKPDLQREAAVQLHQAPEQVAVLGQPALDEEVRIAGGGTACPEGELDAHDVGDLKVRKAEESDLEVIPKHNIKEGVTFYQHEARELDAAGQPDRPALGVQHLFDLGAGVAEIAALHQRKEG